MYRLTENNTKRPLPESVTGIRLMQLAKSRDGESIGFDNGGETALLLNANGETLAVWEYDNEGAGQWKI